jgi:hypothetical protein
MLAQLAESEALEEAVQGIVAIHKKGDLGALQKQIAVALSCVIRLNEKHDALLASCHDDENMLQAAKAEYVDASRAVEEKRYCKTRFRRR